MAAQIYADFFYILFTKINWADAALLHVDRQMVVIPICAASSILL